MGKYTQGQKVPFGKKELARLYKEYASNPSEDLYNNGDLNPLLRNLRTGKLLVRGHHCEKCKAPMTKSCYEKMHYAFCSAWTTVGVTENGKHVRRRVRCGERFRVESGGCGKHNKTQGFNHGFVEAEKHGQCAPDAFDDLTPGDTSEDEDVDDDEDLLCKAREQMLAAGEKVPHDFEIKYWEAKKKVERDLEVESRKAGGKRDSAVDVGSSDTKTTKKERKDVKRAKSLGIAPENEAIPAGKAKSYAPARGKKTAKAAPIERLSSIEESPKKSKTSETALQRVKKTLNWGDSTKDSSNKGGSSKRRNC
jgi:hypothetical protein